MNLKKIVRESGKAGFIGGVISGLINYYLISVPQTPLANSLGNTVSGFISGFMGGFMGVLTFMKKGG